MTSTIRRDKLMKEIDEGKYEARCDFRFDNHFGRDVAKREWIPARISRPKFEEYTNPVGNTQSRCVDHDHVSGKMNLNTYDFTGKVGRATRNDDGTITLYVHSNLWYTLREIK